MLDNGGFFLITTPFLIKVHNVPFDCSRWTASGLKHFLAECGFSLEKIFTDSWGNKACVVGNLDKWEKYNKHFHSLKNDPEFPIVVWGLAQK